MYNSLDALCKRFKISLAEREKHGALIDTRLLSMVYLELHGGKDRALDLGGPAAAASAIAAEDGVVVAYGPRPTPLSPRGTDEERAAHAAFVAKTLKDKAIWARFDGTL
jgi:DNA polymerase-3 subunit epsilon